MKKVATNIPESLLLDAIKATGLNQTQALIEGLKELIAREQRLSLLSLKGKISINVDTGKTRERKKIG